MNTASGSSSASAVSASRRLVFCVLIVVGLSLLLELGSFLVFALVSDGFSYRTMQSRRRELAQEPRASLTARDQSPLWRQQHVIHPYVGYVGNPDMPAGFGPGLSVSSFGFFGDDWPIHQRQEDTLIIGVFGGSVAAMLYSDAAKTLEQQLRLHDPWKHKRFQFISVALAAYKQPQQLLGLSYFLSLGAEFDLIINLDGFNEVVMHPAESAALGVFPAFPRNWTMMTDGYSSAALLPLLGKVSHLQQQRRERATSFSECLLRFSVSGNLYWYWQDRKLLEGLGQAEFQLKEVPAQNSYESTGPPLSFEDEDDLYLHLVDVWARCSRQMANLCRTNGIRYFHFLQPNQYVPDSKPMSPAELAVAYRKNQPYRPCVLKGYPLLVERGADLADEGIDFHDFSQVFREVQEALYVDSCCHLSPLGSEILAQAMAQVILRSL